MKVNPLYYEYVDTRGFDVHNADIDASNCALCTESTDVHLKKRKFIVDGPKHQYKTIIREATLIPSKTAVVSIDMWDNHWCPDDKARALALAPIVNITLNAARAKGIQVIHAPADILGFYRRHPARIRAYRLRHGCPKEELKKNMVDWKPPKLPAFELTKCFNKEANPTMVWTRINPDIHVDNEDFLIDPDHETELFCLLHKLKIDTIIYVGIHS
eukprot:CAMPEP_0168520612 /NCGR_PEP_ID=MMETSP0405-20121227/8127_1 /TAXON_ID=498012 /ORGANISM="Trichosphaerium sp, Strain Am-I-7 wt" /LENGTH=214 /DNA_ID=CAMNT_0008541599 /DNA_START=64 /DNA_END=704 /DNA_ORIENTATION=-